MLILLAIWLALSFSRSGPLNWLLLFGAALCAFLSSSVIGLTVALGLALLVWYRTGR